MKKNENERMWNWLIKRIKNFRHLNKDKKLKKKKKKKKKNNDNFLTHLFAELQYIQKNPNPPLPNNHNKSKRKKKKRHLFFAP